MVLSPHLCVLGSDLWPCGGVRGPARVESAVLGKGCELGQHCYLISGLVQMSLVWSDPKKAILPIKSSAKSIPHLKWGWCSRQGTRKDWVTPCQVTVWLTCRLLVLPELYLCNLFKLHSSPMQ